MKRKPSEAELKQDEQDREVADLCNRAFKRHAVWATIIGTTYWTKHLYTACAYAFYYGYQYRKEVNVKRAKRNIRIDDIIAFYEKALSEYPEGKKFINIHYNCCHWQNTCAYAFYYGFEYGGMTNE